MAKQTINVGTTANDRTGDPLRTAFTKSNANFTELYNTTANIVETLAATATGDITFDAFKIIGAGSASGDGNGYGTIEFVPDDSLYSNDQYLIIDPTFPQHIHIRAGGTQDSSNATLILGGEQTNVTVQDYNHSVIINTGDGVDSYIWEFNNDGTTYLAKNSSSPISYLQTPINDDTIELYLGAGNGVTITANDFSGGDVQWNFGVDGTTTFPNGILRTKQFEKLWIDAHDAENDDYASIGLRSWNDDTDTVNSQIDVKTDGIRISTAQTHDWTFDTDGTLTLPGAVVTATDSPTQGTFPVGEASAMIVTNSPNANWTNGTGVFANGINFAVAVDGSGNATVSVINDGGTGHFVGETFGPVLGTAFGGATPADDMYFEVTAINLGSVTALDLSKQTQILTAVDAAGVYSLADGAEGQIMYFVPSSAVNDGIYVLIDNARIIGTGPEDVTNYSWTPFTGEMLAPTTIAMAIFADGAWCLRGGAAD